MAQPIRILLAEDEEIIAIVIEDILGSLGYQLTICRDGQAAWDCLSADADFDAILLDRGLPRLDGLELLRRIKADPRLARIPVIMETGQSDKNSIREGLNQGAYYYLVKPFQAEVLSAVVQAALQQGRELRDMLESVRRAEHPLALMRQGIFQVRSLEDGRLLANYLARACPQPERAILGLQELLVNAVEHGSLGITYAEKSTLVLTNTWHEEIQRRSQQPEYRERVVTVEFSRNDDHLRFVIEDQGNGFDWRNYLDFSPERAFDLHGRGIALAAKTSLDQIEYQGNGNRVVATVQLAPH